MDALLTETPAVAPPPGGTIDLAIQGMTCASCVRRVERVLGAVPGVTGVAVNLATERAHVSLAGQVIDAAALAEAVRRAGFAVGRDAIDLEIAPHMVFIRYPDQPGVIGRVGSMFGDAGLNIANMAVSRNREGGKALMALSIDTPSTPEVIERLREGADDAYLVTI